MAKILVIEDENPLRQSILETLYLEGFDPIGASDGEHGLQLARETLPDLILCDISMPKLTGYEVLEALRTDHHTTVVPFIFITARGEREEMRDGMVRGANDYLTKPFTRDELLDAIRTQLGKQDAIAQKYETTLVDLRKNIIHALPHELRTPLTQIQGFAELLNIDYDNVEPGAIREMSEGILRASERLQHIVENYLTYAQIDLYAKDPQELQALRNHVLDNPAHIIAAEARRVAERANRETDLKLELTNTRLQISSGNLNKIVSELVDNAFKFSEPGSAVDVRTESDELFYAILIRDRGTGMTAQQIADIGAYMQFDRAVFEQQGLGLGAAIAKQLVALHNGDITFKSKSNQGTLVSISFPVA